MKRFFLTLFLLNSLYLFSQEAQMVNISQETNLEEVSSDLKLDEDRKQNDDEFYEGGPLSHINVSLRLSTMGVGLEAATPINSFLKLRAGINYMGFKSGTFDISLDDPNGDLSQAFGEIPDYKMKGELNFTNGHVLVDFHPVKKGIFHITAGAFIGKNQLKAKGFLANMDGSPVQLQDGQSWPSIEFDGHKLELDDANLDATLQLGNVIKPYFGLGLGRAISKSRVSFKFELGMIYQGKYSIKQNGKKLDVLENATENFEDIDTYTQWLKWWPMLNFQLTYRIF
ncbi:hypothetical protein [Dysgonomonas sp. Marseille-P4361]|uniref:hypothetical protein n=1 Tax=Dysgonomonas sp. Marseille-P4361 TaxID=2161820 RepID=UPI000D55C87D|nr:hypothetical protein [Dysgonomonas sp. Marseille-P4361]